MVIQKFRKFFHRLVLKETCAHKLALSFCFGIYIGFSPFICFHKVLVITLSWLMSLNFAVTLAVSVALNNPFTMVPLYAGDYAVGDFVVNRLFGLNLHTLNPAWIVWLNTKLTYYTGIPELSFWVFLIGGNVLGITLAVSLYPVMLGLFKKLIKRVHQKESRAVAVHESISAE